MRPSLNYSIIFITWPTMYVTEIDIFNAQYKDNNLSCIRPLTIRICGKGSHVREGTMCTKNMIKAQN